ncbi:MAG: response regulator [Nitrospinae bacterium]|nr:response regulator [Nitrospinota bacterium]
MPRVFVVEDETDISGLIRFNLERDGYKVGSAANGEDAIAQLRTFKPDLITLDLMLPSMQGLEVLRHIKGDVATKNVPVIIISAKTAETDKVLGLEMGADDYVLKPFSVKELVSRIKAVLRRTAPAPKKQTFQYKNLQIDFDSVAVKLKGKTVHLSPYEFKILSFLVNNPGRAYSRDEILNNVWKEDAFVMPRTVDVHIRRLRTLIETDSTKPEYIKTVRGFGYIFNPDSTKPSRE